MKGNDGVNTDFLVKVEMFGDMPHCFLKFVSAPLDALRAITHKNSKHLKLFSICLVFSLACAQPLK